MKTLLTIVGVLILAAVAMFSTRSFQRTTHAQDRQVPLTAMVPQLPPSKTQPLANNLAPAVQPRSALQSATLPPKSFQPVNSSFVSAKPAQPLLKTSSRSAAAVPVGTFQTTVSNRNVQFTPSGQFAARGNGFNQPQSNKRPFGSMPGPNSVSSAAISTIPVSVVSNTWPANAKNVTRLIRTHYSLPAGAAESIVTFLASDDNEAIETAIKPVGHGQLVSLQVTTDEQTQRAIATFLAAVYPQKRLDLIKTATSDKELQAPVESPATTPALVPQSENSIENAGIDPVEETNDDSVQ